MVAIDVPPSARPSLNSRITPASLAAAVSAAAPFIVAAVTAAILCLAQLVTVGVWADIHGSYLREAITQWDAAWMTGISDNGYLRVPGRSASESVAFFPGYPIIVRIVAAPLVVFGVEDATLLAALVVSLAACMVMAYGLARLALIIVVRAVGPIGPGTRAAVAAATSVVAFGAPMGVIYAMPYSESLFTALAIWALVAMVERRYAAAGALVLLAGLTRLTAVALIGTLCIAAAVELWRYRRSRRAPYPSPFPWSAVIAPVIGSLGIAGYLGWASYRTRSDGGYFAVQEHGWNSSWDWFAATWDWLANNTFADSAASTDVAFAIASWSMIAVAALVAASLRPLARRSIPWQPWLTAVLIAVIVLGSDGIMHARPRLLLLPVLLLMLPTVTRAVTATCGSRGWKRWLAAAGLIAAGALWCIGGSWISGFMLIDFQYGI